MLCMAVVNLSFAGFSSHSNECLYGNMLGVF